MPPAAVAKNLPSYDPGQSGLAEQTLQRLDVTTPPHEHVLIQSRASGGPGHTFAHRSGHAPRGRQVAARAGRCRTRRGTSPRRSARASRAGLGRRPQRLVTFTVPGSTSHEDQAVVPALRAVAAVQARHPGLLIAEAGDASADRAANAIARP